MSRLRAQPTDDVRAICGRTTYENCAIVRLLRLMAPLSAPVGTMFPEDTRNSQAGFVAGEASASAFPAGAVWACAARLAVATMMNAPKTASARRVWRLDGEGQKVMTKSVVALFMVCS